MALKIGDKAPSFELASTNGNTFELNQYQGQPLVIYFYPKNFTPGCTKEACSFNDNLSVFNSFNINIVGISQDNIASHLKFKEKYNLDFELLADTSGKVSKKYKAMIPIIGTTKRISYLLNAEHVIVAVEDSLFNHAAHINQMKKAVMALE